MSIFFFDFYNEIVNILKLFKRAKGYGIKNSIPQIRAGSFFMIIVLFAHIGKYCACKQKK